MRSRVGRRAQLGYITLARSLMQALSSPLGGFLGARVATDPPGFCVPLHALRWVRKCAG